MKELTKGITEGDKQILKSAVPLLVIILLFIFVGKFGISQISGLRSKIREMDKTHSTLTQKMKILASVSESAPEWADSTIYALPKENPSLQILSQIKILALNNGLILTDVKTSSGNMESKDLSSITTSLNITGSKDAIVAFTNDIDKIAPLTFITKMELSESGGVGNADITAKTYYAELPKTIPSVTQAVTDLTSNEKELILLISELNQSIIGEQFEPSSESINISPFGE